MNKAEKLIEIKVKHEILVEFLKNEIKDREDRGYSYLDKDELKKILEVMGYYKEDAPEVEEVKTWAGEVVATAPALDVPDEEAPL